MIVILSNIMYTYMYPNKPAWKSCVVSYCWTWFSSWLNIVMWSEQSLSPSFFKEYTALYFNHCTILPINIGTRTQKQGLSNFFSFFLNFHSFSTLKFHAPFPFLCVSSELFTFLSAWYDLRNFIIYTGNIESTELL